MKKILLLSDTHAHIDEQILTHAKQADEVWHAGDIGELEVMDELAQCTTLRAVHGNIDNHVIRQEYPKDLYFDCERVKVWITHIGGYPNRYPAIIKEELLSAQPDLFICGHSHILKVMWDKKYNLLHMNPGAVGHYGIHQVRTMLRFQIEGSDIKKLEVIEVLPRQKSNT